MKKIIGILAGLFFIISFGTAQAITYSGFGAKPAYPRPDNPRTTDIFVHRLQPGDVQKEGVYIINNSQETKSLMVYAADYTPSTDGGFACKQLAETQTGVGTWITFGAAGAGEAINEVASDSTSEDSTTNEVIVAGENANTSTNTNSSATTDTTADAAVYTKEPVIIELDPGVKSLLPFLITVPQQIDVGEHDGCILVQEADTSTKNTQGINLQTRTGLRVAITIEGQISRSLILQRFDILARPGGGKILHPVVQNTGNVSVDADITVTTNNMFGKEYARHGGRYSIITGDTGDWNFELEPSFWGGWYTSQVEVSYDTDTNAELGVRTEEKTTLSSEPQRFFMYPSVAGLIIYIVIVLALLALIAIGILALRRRRIIASTWIEYTVKKTDSVRELAKLHNVSWKLLARVNKLKAPYALDYRDILLVPPQADAAPASPSRRKASTKKKKDITSKTKIAKS